MPDKVKIAVIGIGHIGGIRAQRYRKIDGCELVAICDYDKNRLSAFYADNGYVKTNPDYIALLQQEKELDAVHVSVNATEQKSVIESALWARKNVLVEKPFTTSYQDAVQLVGLAKRMGVYLMVGVTERHNPIVNYFKNEYLDPDKGTIDWKDAVLFREERLGMGRESMDVTVARDLLPHSLDMIYYLTNERPQVNYQGIRTVGQRLIEVPVEVMGVTGNIYAGWEMKWRRRHLILTFPSEEYILSYASQELERKLPVGDTSIQRPSQRKSHADITALSKEMLQPLEELQGEPFLIEQEKFIETIRKGELTEGLCSGEEALPIVLEIDKIEKHAYPELFT